MQQRNVRNPVTRELFHGTNADVCDNIYKDGFDRSHCGKNGILNKLSLSHYCGLFPVCYEDGYRKRKSLFPH